MTTSFIGWIAAVFVENLAEPALKVCLFLLSYCIFPKARCVRVGEIWRILIGLIEHFSTATRISSVFLNQLRDEPDIFVR